jgi:hypothetical protein
MFALERKGVDGRRRDGQHFVFIERRFRVRVRRRQLWKQFRKWLRERFRRQFREQR